MASSTDTDKPSLPSQDIAIAIGKCSQKTDEENQISSHASDDGAKHDKDGSASDSENDSATGEDEAKDVEPTQKMSKNQMKKLKKKQRWLEIKSEKRRGEKQRRKQKRREARDKGEDLGPSRKKLKQNTMATSSCDIRVAIDCSFDHIMTEKDVCKMVQQIQHSYSANRRSEQPMQLYVTSVGGKCQTRLDVIGDYNNWDLHFKAESFGELFDKSSVVYLSSDSDNVLETLESDKVYVIGGLVDHNHFKGLCHNMAVEYGYAHAQLPIGSYMDMKTRKVLTVNQVVEILLRFTETQDWEEAFFAAIPKRKGAVVKTEAQHSKEKDSEEGPDVDKSGSPAEVSTSEGAALDKDCAQPVTVADAATVDSTSGVISTSKVSELEKNDNKVNKQECQVTKSSEDGCGDCAS